MGWDQIEGEWKQMKGKVKESWDKFTDDDLLVIGGKRNRLIGLIQLKYGYAKEEAEKQIRQWESGLHL